MEQEAARLPEANPSLQALKFLKKRGVEGKVIFCMVTGSQVLIDDFESSVNRLFNHFPTLQAYNLSQDNSDYDFFGVC
mgnify:FL=1